MIQAPVSGAFLGRPSMSETETPIRLTVHGAAGRMGQRIVALAANDAQLSLVAAIDSPTSRALGRDAGELAGIGRVGVTIAADLATPTDVIIDFSVPEATMKLVAECSERRLPVVIATTGLNERQRGEVAAAAQFAPIVFAPSMSLAVNVAMKLVREAAKSLRGIPDGVDVEIVERHHRFKEDAPSGTALKFGQIVAEEMGQTGHQHGRQGQTGKRPRNEIGYHAVRTGDNVGEHQIIFGLMGETLEVYVRGHTRDSYAYGALAAAKFLAGRPAGLYTMADVLGL
jgi:4-hydroxy-tetrahydrodipicolinate reductase